MRSNRNLPFQVSIFRGVLDFVHLIFRQQYHKESECMMYIDV